MPDNERDRFRQAFDDVAYDVREGLARIGLHPDDSGGREEITFDGQRNATGLGPPFEGFEALTAETRGERTQQFTVVPWKYSCVHDGGVADDVEQAGIFAGLFPTGREVTIRGVTFVDHSSGEPQYHRYVDWADALTQLGCTVSQRVLVTEDEYVKGLRALRPDPES